LEEIVEGGNSEEEQTTTDPGTDPSNPNDNTDQTDTTDPANPNDSTDQTDTTDPTEPTEPEQPPTLPNGCFILRTRLDTDLCIDGSGLAGSQVKIRDCDTTNLNQIYIHNQST
jgi:hypothetical protein